MDDLPMLRTQLQALSFNNTLLLEKQAKDFIELEVKKITQKVIDAANIGKSELVYREKDGLTAYYYLQKYIRTQEGLTQTKYSDCTSKKYIIYDLIMKLKTKFPDCDITVDPLNTYIIIDWS